MFSIQYCGWYPLSNVSNVGTIVIMMGTSITPIVVIARCNGELYLISYIFGGCILPLPTQNGRYYLTAMLFYTMTNGVR